ncbi:MAG: division/cell wall cluster transcriptional repressor MraZ [Spirochaeta sp.]|nr:division/cell wall cluster transcriptional repressor MraZ [Spirochaeta sp.]RPG13087.1 MAG: division/cell wall cluster transcriptional repressor MraZ [Proteobacteria bacterium TMED72]
MFRGRFEHAVDTKGRMSIPSEFRVEIQRRSERDPVITNYGDHLALFPADEWETKEAELLGLSEFDTDAQDFQRYVVGEAMNCPIDGQGRILVPNLLRKEAELKTKVIITGVLNKVEIWNPERFEEKRRMTLMRLSEIQHNVDPQRRTSGD